jgi:hypothetical protein
LSLDVSDGELEGDVSDGELEGDVSDGGDSLALGAQALTTTIAATAAPPAARAIPRAIRLDLM